MNALITGNSAGGFGGGVGACPTGETLIVNKDGAAIYGNEASGTNMSGGGNNKTYDSTLALNSTVFMSKGYADYFCVRKKEGANAPISLVTGQMAGGGAAGGMGIAAAVFLNADIKPGIEIVLNAVYLAQAVQGAALVITGEGRIDSQTAGGKAPLGVASVAKKLNVPVIGIAGVLGDGVEVVHQYGIDAVFSILPRLAPLAEVLASGETNLFNSARNIACAIKIGQGIKN